MYCSMFDHYMVVDHEGKFKVCTEIGEKSSFDHVQFDSYDAMSTSDWLKSVKAQMERDEWPDECRPCREKEEQGIKSLRLLHNASHEEHYAIRPDYLKVEIVTDNICNGGCQFCHAGASSKIGSLTRRDYPKVNNMQKFYDLPQDRITEVDIIGGEPSYSPNTKELLTRLPPNVIQMRFTTNGSRVMTEIIPFLEKGIKVRMSISFDGIGNVYDYVRWPVKYKTVRDNMLQYVEMSKIYPGLVISPSTTLCSLNVNDADNIFSTLDEIGIQSTRNHFCLVSWPAPLDPRFTNRATVAAKEKYKDSTNPKLKAIANMIATKENNQEAFDKFVSEQDALRKISITDYITI